MKMIDAIRYLLQTPGATCTDKFVDCVRKLCIGKSLVNMRPSKVIFSCSHTLFSGCILH